MKQFKFLLLLAALTLTTQAQIQLAWQYDFDTSRADNPTHTFSIEQIRTSESNYCLVEYRSSESESPREHRLVLLNPVGEEIWVSDNIHTTYSGEDDDFAFVEILQIGAGTTTVGVFYLEDSATNEFREAIYRFEQNKAPNLQIFELSQGEFPATFRNSPESSLLTFLTPTSKLGEGGFFTTVGPSDIDPPLSVRRYVFGPAPTVSIVTTGGVSSGSAILVWESETGASYQIQTSTNLTTWSNIGGVIIGSGSQQTWASETQTASAYFRVVRL